MALRYRHLLILLAIVALAGWLRFWNLGGQSYWYDEIATLGVLKPSLWHTLSALPDSESTPPLYYVVAWVWKQLFGDGALALRSLSALVGLAAVAVTYLAGREAVSARVGLAAAAVMAVNPMLIWYSQEARAYSLVVLLASLSLWLWLRALRAPLTARLAAWAAVCCLALATHYFAVFVVLGEAAVLLVSAAGRRQAVALSLLPIGLVGAALIPLAHAQEKDGRTAWIAHSALGGRVGDVVRELGTADTNLISSNSHAPYGPWWILASAGVLIGVFAAARLTDRAGRRAARLAVLVGAAALLVPLALALTPLDYFKDRNLIAAWPVLALALGAGLSAAGARWLGWAALVAIAAAGVAVTVQVAGDSPLQRADWRAANAALGPPAHAREILVEPAYARAILQAYGRRLSPLQAGAKVSELDVIGTEAPPARRAPPRVGNLVAVERRQVQQVSVLRYVAATPFVVAAGQANDPAHPPLLELGPSGAAWASAVLDLEKQLASQLANASRSRPAAPARRAELRSDLERLATLSRSAPPELPSARVVIDDLRRRAVQGLA